MAFQRQRLGGGWSEEVRLFQDDRQFCKDCHHGCEECWHIRQPGHLQDRRLARNQRLKPEIMFGEEGVVKATPAKTTVKGIVGGCFEKLATNLRSHFGSSIINFGSVANLTEHPYGLL